MVTAVKLLSFVFVLMFVAVGCKKQAPQQPEQTATESQEKSGELTKANEALLFAADRGDIDKIHSLLSIGADANTATNTGMSALHLAALKGHNDVIDLLLANGACAGQVIFHVHFHIVPRSNGDGLGFAWRHGSYADGEMDRVHKAILAELGE